MKFLLDEKAARLYSQLKTFQNIVNKTNRFIFWALEQVENPYVACSFGKDSSVMLDIVLQYMPKIPVRFVTYPETRLLDNYDSVIDWWKKEKKINYSEVKCDDKKIVKEKHKRGFHHIGTWDSFFVGIRAEESFGRRVSLRNYGKFHKTNYGIIKISPLAWWKEQEISAYIVSHGLPILDKYKKEGFSARTTSEIPREFYKECLLELKNRDINSWNKICTMFPDARGFV